MGGRQEDTLILSILDRKKGGRDSKWLTEPVFLNVYGAQESIPRNEFRQPM